jgi:septal ring factor EnvC (AmiA/AmiB activator)
MRVAAILSACLMLAGCSDPFLQSKLAAAEKRAEQAEQQINQLSDKLQAGYLEKVAKERATFERWERQAEIAAACDYLLPLCPVAVVLPGREAHAAGYGGGGARFWGLVAAKLAALAAATAAAVVTLRVGFLKFAMPAAEELEHAQVTIAEARGTIGWAQTEEEEARKRAEQLRAEVKQLEAQRANTAKLLEAGKTQLAQIQAQLAAAQQKAEQLESGKAASAAALAAAFGKPKR